MRCLLSPLLSYATTVRAKPILRMCQGWRLALRDRNQYLFFQGFEEQSWKVYGAILEQNRFSMPNARVQARIQVGRWLDCHFSSFFHRFCTWQRSYGHRQLPRLRRHYLQSSHHNGHCHRFRGHVLALFLHSIRFMLPFAHDVVRRHRILCRKRGRRSLHSFLKWRMFSMIEFDKHEDRFHQQAGGVEIHVVSIGFHCIPLLLFEPPCNRCLVQTCEILMEGMVLALPTPFPACASTKGGTSPHRSSASIPPCTKARERDRLASPRTACPPEPALDGHCRWRGRGRPRTSGSE